jgi:integrase
MGVSAFGPDEVASILLAIKEGGAPREAEKVRAVLLTVFNVARGKTRKIALLKGSWLPSSTPNPVDGVMLEQRDATNYKPSTRELRSYVRGLDDLGDIGAVLRVQIETASRIGEVAGMTWQELDLEQGVWSLPAERSKNGKAHKVMLARQTIERLRVREGNGSPYIFPAPTDPAKPIRTDAVQHRLADARDSLGIKAGFTSHSTRHAALTWLAEQGCTREVRDRISNHKAAANFGVDHIYVAAELNTPAREWTQRWVDYLTRLGAENVVLMSEGASR